jgi:hypothetical protein
MNKMNFEMQKANLLADNIGEFIKFVYDNYENKRSFLVNTDKLYQVKLLVEEYKFRIIADELHRINQFSWDEKYTFYLVNQFKQGVTIIDEYVRNHNNDLFILTARLHTLKNLYLSFSNIN